jgi:hypothetical protein
VRSVRRRSRPLVGDRRLFAAATFFLAFAVRMLWTVRVQSPFAAIYSDMGGYVTRAEHLLAGTTPGEPRILAIWPWGTHVIVAVELLLFGKKHAIAIDVLHSFVGAIPAGCAALLTARFTRSRAAVAAAGFGVALWHPLVVYAGFFSSEIWFAAAASMMTLLFARACEGRRGALAAGIATAIAFCVRPQMVLTVGLVVIAFVLFRPARLSRAKWAAFLLPLVLAVSFSAWRMHHLTGKWGLIASYEPVQRLFGETNVRRIDATWTAPDGARWGWWFAPHTRPRGGQAEAVRFEGFVTDTEILAALRKERTKNVPLLQRIARMGENLSFLMVNDLPWPEDDFKQPPFRPKLQQIFSKLGIGLVVLATLGLAFLRRHRPAAIVIYAHVAALLVSGSIYLPEVRYRIPYDPLLFVVAFAGVAEAAASVRRNRAQRAMSAVTTEASAVQTTSAPRRTRMSSAAHRSMSAIGWSAFCRSVFGARAWRRDGAGGGSRGGGGRSVGRDS